MRQGGGGGRRAVGMRGFVTGFCRHRPISSLARAPLESNGRLVPWFIDFRENWVRRRMVVGGLVLGYYKLRRVGVECPRRQGLMLMRDCLDHSISLAGFLSTAGYCPG